MDVENNYEAAYRVIEAELAFTHDHFFTSSASFNTKLSKLIIFLSIGKVCAYPLMAILLIPTFIQTNDKTRISETEVVPVRLFEAILIAVIMLDFSILEHLQLYLYLSSDWAKIQLVRFYVSGKSIQWGTYMFSRDRSRRPEGGEWEPIKISSKFESSAYIPKITQALKRSDQSLE